MPGYTPQSEIRRREELIKSLGQNTRDNKLGFFSAFREGREGRDLAAANTQNADIRSGELQSLLQSMRQGGLQGPGNPQLNLQTPELKNIQLQQAMKSQQDKQKQQDAMALQESRNQGQGGFGANPIWGRDANGNPVVLQTSRGGGPLSQANAPEGVTLSQPGSIAGSDVRSIGETGAAELQNTINELNQTGSLRATNAGMVTRAQEGEQLSAELEGMTRRHDLELELSVNQRLSAMRTEERKAQLANEWIDEAIGMADNMSAGFFGALTTFVPQSPSHQLASVLKSLESHIGFDTLQEMRDNSPTGGALGAINEKELDQLNAAMGSIKLSNGPEMLKRNLERVREEINRIVNGSAADMGRDFGDIQSQADAILGL